MEAGGMCGRFTQRYTWAELHALLDLIGPPRNLRPRHNIAPTTTIDVVRSCEPRTCLDALGPDPSLVEEVREGGLFNAYYDEHGFQPIVVFDADGRPVAAMLRPAKRPTGAEARSLLRRLIREIRGHWPRVEILIRADSHYCAPEVLDFCRAARIDFLLGVATTTTLRRHVETLEASTARRQTGAQDSDKLRRYKEFHDGAASWSRVERIIARVEASAQGTDTRFVVTNLAGGSARTIYEDLYCRRGQAENHIKAWKRHLAADRTSCCCATANQFRLMLHTGAYWLLWSLRSLMPRRSTWRVAQFDTLRLRLVKLATRVVALKTRVMLHLPSACPDKAILRLALERLLRLAC
jgi:hypothetical protein